MRLRLLFALLVLAIAVPIASADTILDLNFTQLSGYTHTLIGTVDLHQVSAGVVQVTLTATPGFSFKLKGGDVFFNTSATLSASNISGLTAGGNPVTDSFSLHAPAPFGKFDYDLRNLKGSGNVATTITFLVSANNLTVADFGKFGVHFCVGTTCGTGNTGFATVGGPAVPEPGTLSLLGTGILGLAGFFRRRLLS